MRGAPISSRPLPVRDGIIPADAGSTVQLELEFVPDRDHPRGCGEHNSLIVTALFPVGSSPRMRGAPAGHVVRAGESRIIPADAGSTARSGAR